MARKASDTHQLLRGTLELLLLQALTDGPLHGYAIARRIETATGDALAVEEGSMYPAMHRLEAAGAVTARWATAAGTGRRVRVYALTRSGRKRLEAQKRDWRTFSKAVARMVETD